MIALYRSESLFILAIKISKKTVKILISDQIAFAAVVYFGQVFGFCRLINKSVLKWFLLTRTMTRSALFSRNHPTLLLIKKRRSTDATGGFLAKNFSIFTRKHICWSLFFNFIEKRLQNRCFPVNIGKFLKKLFWRTSPDAYFWRVFRKWLIRTFVLKRRFQSHPNLVILQKYQSLSNQNSLYI